MDLGPEEKFGRFSELSENRALKPFAHFCVQPAAPGLKLNNFFVKYEDEYALQGPQNLIGNRIQLFMFVKLRLYRVGRKYAFKL